MFKRNLLLVLGFLATVVASPSLWALQFAHPDGTIGSTADYTFNTTGFWQDVGEGSPPDDGTLIETTVNPGVIEFSLTNTITDPGVDTGHIIKFRAVNPANNNKDVTISLYEGAGLVGESTITVLKKTTAWAEYAYPIPTAVIGAYNNLSIRISANGTVASPQQISWIELEIPTAAATVAPTVTSATFANVTDTTATLGGNVTANGGATVTSRGVEWGLLSGGPYPNSEPAGAGGTGIFTVPVTGLPVSTLIYFRAWATNTAGTGVSSESSFTTNAAAVVPTVTSPTFADVTDTTATLGGNVTADGGSPILARGTVWNTTGTPVIQNSLAEGGTTTGVFTHTRSTLPPATIIFFRAYATNAVGTSYSPQSSFTTNAAAVAPTVTSPTFADVTDTTATLGGNVTADGGATVTSRGVEWGSLSGGPYSNSKPDVVGGTGVFTVPVTLLPPSATIYFRAWATNSVGTTFSAQNSFATTAPAAPPNVTSPTATGITDTTATLGGNVIADGGATVTARGVVWNTTTPAESGGTVVPMGSGLGVFSQLVGSLPAGTLIYFKAYATNTAGTDYSLESSFTTNTAAPTVTSPTFADVTDTTATLGGNVTADGGATITDRGVEWGETPGGPYPNSVPEGGTSTGVFTVPVTGLTTSATIYFRAWATNSVGTGYSTESSFVATSGAIVQASNITFPRVSGRSLRISWTRGTGDGSIVVLRLTATGIVDPLDGDDYTANPDYSAPPPELPTSSGNFVVYKGSNNSVLVSGLTLSTSYSVAIYEYTGTGASTVYVLTPAEATQATTNMPVHNEDNVVNCSECHSHGQWFARGAELDAVCTTCHNASGVASAKLEFANHLTPTSNPAIDIVDCGFCHELHSPGGTNTTESLNNVTGSTLINKSFLRANVDKYVAGAVPPAYLHTDTPKRVDPHPDAPQTALTPDRAVEGGLDAVDPPTADQARGYCQVCHTMTSNHTNNPSTSGSLQTHDGGSNTSGLGTEVNCGSCHQHNNNFTPEGGSCVSCHDQPQGPLPRPIITTQFDRLSSHITGGSGVVTQEDCLVCHDQTGHPGDQIVGLKNADDGTIYEQATAGAPPTSEGEVFAPVCLSCHDDGSADALAGGDPDQTPTSPFTGSGAPPVIDLTAWGLASHNRPVATSGSSPVTCVGDGANGCHGSGHGSEQLKLLAPAAGPNTSPANFCFNCHDSDGPSSLDILAEFTPVSPQEYIGGSNYTEVNKQHDVLAADQAYSGATVSCADCHSPHTANNAMPAKNPDTGLALGTYSPTNSYSGDSPSFTYDSGSGTDLDPSNPIGPTVGGPFVDTDYIEFCLTCHDGTAPPGVTLPPSATLLNIAVAFAVDDQHGNLVGNGSASRGYLKKPWATQAQYDAGNQPPPYAALNCTLCHGPHGSGNIYNLRTSITVAGEVMNVGGVDVFTGESGPTYVLPDGGSGQEQFGWGAWCTFCHEPSHDTRDGLGCQSGHTHGGGNF